MHPYWRRFWLVTLNPYSSLCVLGALALALVWVVPALLAPSPPRAAPPIRGPVYTLPQVLAGWHTHPDRWVGRTIFLRASFNDSTEGPGAPPSDASPFPMIYPGHGVPSLVLYDGLSQEYIPAIAGPDAWPSDPLGDERRPADADRYWDPVAVYRVALVVRADCGALGRGHHPCLLGEVVSRMP